MVWYIFFVTVDVKELFETKFGQVMQFLRLHLEMLWPIDWFPLAGTLDRTGLPTIANLSTTALPWRELVNLIGWISTFLREVTRVIGRNRHFKSYFCLINFGKKYFTILVDMLSKVYAFHMWIKSKVNLGNYSLI